MKTLIIHPKDGSTEFLETIYRNIEDKTVITGGVSKYEVMKLIESHDRIMFMGHGSPFGLFSMGRFNNVSNGYIIDNTTVELLENKDNVVYIWCNADQFVNRFGLKGFYSGMFISEVGEANYCGVYGTNQNIVDESNFRFVEIVGESINNELDVVFETVVEQYGELIKTNKVAEYNQKRLYFKN